jgi:hypothetical protein
MNRRIVAWWIVFGVMVTAAGVHGVHELTHKQMHVRLGGCAGAKKQFHLEHVNCCTSCHDDLEAGFHDPAEIITPDGYYDTCCAISNEYERVKSGKKL